MGNPKQKWTAEEEDALRAGVAKHDGGRWNGDMSTNVVRRVTRSGAAKHKASTQERKLDLKKDASINRKPGSTANNKASSQAKELQAQLVLLQRILSCQNPKSSYKFCAYFGCYMMFTLPSISDSIKVQDINEDSDGMMKRNHGVPSDTNVYVEEPLNVTSRKRIRQTDSDVKRSAPAKHKASTQERKLDIINKKRGAAANDKASPQANVVYVTCRAAAKHKAFTQVSKLDIKKDVIKRKRGAAANDKSSPQAKMFLGTLPLIFN
nr:telomere repeat-binding factor 4 [Tanacetum cinerariifolium]